MMPFVFYKKTALKEKRSYKAKKPETAVKHERRSLLCRYNQYLEMI